MPEADADAVDEASTSLRSLGIEIRRGAPGSITLRAIPACLTGIAPGDLLDTVAGWAKQSGPVPALIDSLAALAGSCPFDGDVGDVIDAAAGGRLGAAVTAVDEAMLRDMVAGATRR